MQETVDNKIILCQHLTLLWEYDGWGRCNDCWLLIRVHDGLDSNLQKPSFRL